MPVSVSGNTVKLRVMGPALKDFIVPRRKQMGKLVITVCRDVVGTVRRGKQTSWAPPIQVAQKSVFSKSSSDNSQVALEGLPNLN